MTFCKTTLLAVSALAGSAALADEHVTKLCNGDLMNAIEKELMIKKLKKIVLAGYMLFTARKVN